MSNSRLKLAVQHFGYWKAEATVIDGRTFVEFSSLNEHRYLVLLVRKANRLYALLTGQHGPNESFLLVENYPVGRKRGAGG